jgi:hypothetical protein
MPTDAGERWQRLVERMLAAGAATYGNAASDGAKRGFGSTSLKTGGRIFAMLAHERLVVKLPAKRVEELAASGVGRRFDPGHGRLQREWLDVSSDEFETWIALATEAESFVGRRSRTASVSSDAFRSSSR